MIKNLLFIFSTILIIFSIYLSKDIKLDASSDTLILQNNKTFEYYKYYNKIFPSKNFLILAIKSKKKIDEEYIKNINDINEDLSKLSNIESTLSIVDLPILLLNNKKISNLANQNIDNINNSDYKLKNILNEFSTSPLFKDQIINTDENISSIIVYIKENSKFKKIQDLKKNNLNDIEINKKYQKIKEIINTDKKILIKEIRNTIKNQSNNYEYFLGGIDMIASDTIRFVEKDILIFSFAVIIIIIFILLFIYRDIKWVTIPLISTIYSLLIMTGFIGIMRWEITAISSNFISLMLILSVSMNIHIINHYKINYQKQNIIQTIKKMFWPCFYTTLTTIVAFGSLLFSNIKPLIDFGNIMIAGLIIILITSFTILPLIIFYFPKIESKKSINFNILYTFYGYAINYTKTILIFNLIIFIISIYGIYQLNVENSFINYFKKNTEIYKGMKLIDSELGGTTPIDIIIKFKDIENNQQINIDNLEYEDEDDLDLGEDLDLGGDLFTESDLNINWFNSERLKTIKKIHSYLEGRNEIGKVQSINSLIEIGNQINNKKLSIFELSILYNEIPLDYKKILINPYLSTEKNMIKISARIRDSNDIERNKLILDINNYIEKNFSNIEKYNVNGLLVLYNDMLQSLFSSQIKSFGIILISIFIMFIILFRSIKLSVIGIIPNIMASVFILGFIGILGIPLDIMTITIAAITIGIAVDNTIHYIYRVKENLKYINNVNNLIKQTHENVGKAVLTTSLTIAFGFSILCLSNFIPTILFGLFTALAMIIAMLGVLLTLPAVMIKYKI